VALSLIHFYQETQMVDRLKHFIRDDEGQDLIEYGLLAALISLAAILAITNVGSSLTATYNSFSAQISGS
jgi:pilus assembly protein Flp/PilA